MNTAHKEALTFLKQHKVGILSTASKNNKLWGAAIYYVVDEHFNFYFLTRAESKKYQNMLEHPQVALTVADDDQQSTAQISGKISEVPIGDEQNEVYRMLVQVHPPGEFSWTPPVSKLDQGQIILLKLTPDALQFANFKTLDHQGMHINKII